MSAPGLPQETLRHEIRRRFDRALDAYYPKATSPELIAVIDAYLRRPAKLLRPRLLLLSAKAHAPETPREPLLELAAATELLHVFALTHDDRMDRDGREGVSLSLGTGHGAQLILAGDLLHTLATGMIEESVAEYRLSPAIPRWVRRVSCKTIAGQAADVRFLAGSRQDMDALYRLYDLKTGYYSFVAPLVIGALAAGVGNDRCGPLEELGLLLGRAFQLRDDQADLRRRVAISAVDDGADRATDVGAHDGAGGQVANRGAGSLAPWELNLLATLEEGSAGTSSARPTSADDLARRVEAVHLTEAVDGHVEAILKEAEGVARELAIDDPSGFLAEIRRIASL